MGRRIHILSYSLIAAFGVLLGVIARDVAPGGRWSLAPRQGGGRDNAYERRAEQLSVLSRPTAVVMIGDSLTADGEWSELLGPQVVDRGIGRDTTAWLLDRLPTVPPSKVAFLLIGTNDVIQGVPLDQTEARTQTIVVALRRKVFLQSVPHLAAPAAAPRRKAFDRSAPHFAETYTALNRKIDRLNESNRAFCATGACVFVDIRPAIEGKLAADGMHLNGRAYVDWAATIRPLVVEAIQRS